MAETIAFNILIVSFLGMLVIFLRKLPVLISLPQEIGGPQESLLFRLKDRILKIRPFRSFSFEFFLQKVLSKIRVLSLKIESKTANHLQKMREKSREQKGRENDNYWQELQKPTKKDDKEGSA